MRSLRRMGLAALILPLLAVGLLAVADPAGAQERDLVFNQVTVSSGEASIRLEFAEGDELSVAFRDGRILVNGSELGRYEPGDALDQSWRALLREAVGLDNSELLELVAGWSPPSELEGRAAQGASELANRLSASLQEPAARPVPVVVGPEGEFQDLVQVLVTRTDRLRALASALRNLSPEDMRVHVGENVVVGADETVESTLLIVDGNLTLDGTVEGDVLVLGGGISLGDDARIAGDLRWTEGSVSGNRAAVAGRIVEIQPVPDRPEQDLREEIQRELRAAMETVQVQVGRDRAPRGFRMPPVIRNVVEGLGRLFQTMLTFGILFGIGLALLAFLPRNFEVVARTARYATGRSALVGLATGVLAFPVWIVGIVVLAITIIGIPVMLLWLPLFPAAVALAALVGLLAVARNMGRWGWERRTQGMDAFDGGRPAVQLGIGLVILLGAFAVAAVFHMGGGWFSIFKGLATAIGALATVAAAMIGTGAVVLSRGGRDPLYAGPGWTYAGEQDPWGPEPGPDEPTPGDSAGTREWPEPETPQHDGPKDEGPAEGGSDPSDPWTDEGEPPHER